MLLSCRPVADLGKLAVELLIWAICMDRRDLTALEMLAVTVKDTGTVTAEGITEVRILGVSKVVLRTCRTWTVAEYIIVCRFTVIAVHGHIRASLTIISTLSGSRQNAEKSACVT